MLNCRRSIQFTAAIIRTDEFQCYWQMYCIHRYLHSILFWESHLNVFPDIFFTTKSAALCGGAAVTPEGYWDVDFSGLGWYHIEWENICMSQPNINTAVLRANASPFHWFPAFVAELVGSSWERYLCRLHFIVVQRWKETSGCLKERKPHKENGAWW